MENTTLFSEIEIQWSLGEGRFCRFGSNVIFDDMEKNTGSFEDWQKMEQG